jgi:broad specificity phosphatase PhoE
MIYFVRHGLSEANVKRVFAGQKDDSPLVDEGREQAKQTANEILKEDIKIDRIVSSPSIRAFETAQIIASILGFNKEDIFIDNRINEYDMGSLSGTPWHTVSSSVLVSAENAEDTEKFRFRVCSCVEELSKLPENILLVSHAGVGRMIETIKDRIDSKFFYDLPAYKNASITKIDWIK